MGRRTDLHVVEGDLAVHRPHVVPGHDIVGAITEVGDNTETDFSVDDIVGIPWLRHTCGNCRFWVSGRENLCKASLYTGWDHNGGFAEYAVVSADYALALPTGYSTEELAPAISATAVSPAPRSSCRSIC